MAPREELLLVTEDSDSIDVQPPKKSVQFGMIHVREYNRIVGDHPDVRVGPPISLGWEYSALPEVTIDSYEKTRPNRRAVLRLSSITRKNMLHNVFGISEEEIRASEKEIQKIQRQREFTNKQGKTSVRVESAVRSVGRKFRRTFSAENVFRGLSAASGHMSPIAVQA